MKTVRVLCIIPYPGMNNVMQTIAEEFPELEISIYTGNLKGAVKVAEKYFYRDGFDLIISRGSTAVAVQNAGFPVISIDISYYDIIQAIRLAEGMPGKLAMTVFADLAAQARTLCSMLNYEIEIVPVENLATARETITALTEQRKYTLLCDTIAYQIAQSLGAPSFLITSGAESIRKSFRQALTVSEELHWLRAERNFYRSLLSDHNEETIVFNADGRLLFSSVASPDNELLAVLRKEIPGATEERTRLVRKYRGITYFIRIRRMHHAEHELISFCIEKRKIPAMSGNSGIRYLSISELENFFPNAGWNTQDILNLYLSDIKRLAQAKAPILIAGEDASELNQVANTIFMHSARTSCSFVYINCNGLTEKSLEFLLEHYDSPLTDTGTTIHIAQMQVLPTVDRQNLIDLLLTLKVWNQNRLILSVAGKGAESSRAAEEILSRLPCQSLNLIALRNRREDIPVLVKLTLGQFNIGLVSPILEVEPEAMRLLQEYSWPQNYVQFARVMRELISAAADQRITRQDVISVLKRESACRPFEACECDNASSLQNALQLNGTLAEMNKEIAKIVLKQTRNNQSATAKQLGISRTTLWRLLKN